MQPKKTETRIRVGNRNLIVYKGVRGGLYIKRHGAFVSLKSLKPNKRMRGGDDELTGWNTEDACLGNIRSDTGKCIKDSSNGKWIRDDTLPSDDGGYAQTKTYYDRMS